MQIKCTNGKIYNSAKEAAEDLNIPRQNIDRILRKERVTVKGYSFCYINEDFRKPRWETKPRKIKCLETGEIFNSAHDLARKYNMESTFFIRVCRGKRKTVKGLHFCYAEENKTIEEIESKRGWHRKYKTLENFDLEKLLDECFIKNEYFYEMLNIFKEKQKEPLEKHHIIPRSWFKKNGFTVVDKDNLVSLSALNHFKVHELILKCCKPIIKNEMNNAFLYMSSLNNVQEEEYQKSKEAFIEKYGKKVKCLETGEIFSSIHECCRKEGLDKSSLNKVLKGKRKSLKGKHYELAK